MDAQLRIEDWLGRQVEVAIDRPLGSAHPEYPDLRYPLNYGFVPGTLAPDGEAIDVYVLGADEPLVRCTATVIAIIRRRDDIEDKLVAAVAGQWDEDEIAKAVAFQECYFDSWVEIVRPPDS
jgi:inorganic pyrophosphatase